MRREFSARSMFAAGLVLVGMLMGAIAAHAQSRVPAIFEGADLKLGEELIAQNKCSECHIRKVGGDGSAIYRPKGRISTAGFLRGQVELCNTQLGLSLFPEETTAIAAVLNRDHYKFEK